MTPMTPYHRLARESPDFAHWRLPVAALTGIGAFAFASFLLVLVWMVGLLVAGVDADAWIDLAGTEIAVGRPSVLAFQLGSIALLLPCVLGPVAIFWRRHVGYLHSVEGRVRWGWLGRCTALAFAVVAASLVLSVAVAAVAGDEVRPEALDGTRVTALVVVVLVVPFQAAAEEYVFRGGLLQLVGSWTRWAVVPVVLTSLLFAAGHVYNVWGLVSVFLFGVVAAVMTIRTGGLEAAIGLHIANNVVLMVFDTVGLVDSTGEGAGVVDEVLPTTVMCLVFWALVEAWARRTGLQRRRAPLPEPVSAPAYRFVPPAPVRPAAGHPAGARGRADDGAGRAGVPAAARPGQRPAVPRRPRRLGPLSPAGRRRVLILTRLNG